MKLQDAAREARLPLPVATAVRRELEKAGMLERRHGLTLTDDGREFVETAIPSAWKRRSTSTCALLRSTASSFRNSSRPGRASFAPALAAAPSVDVTLDQAPCSPRHRDPPRLADAAERSRWKASVRAAARRRRFVSIAIGLVGRALPAMRPVASTGFDRDPDERRLSLWLPRSSRRCDRTGAEITIS